MLYVSGFDPQGPGHYHSLYVEQAAVQASVNGVRIDVGARQRSGSNAAWDVHWHSPDGAMAVETRYEFLRWDDIVRQHWPRGQGRLLALTLAATARMLANGSLWRILQTSWPAFVALAAPAAVILAVTVGLLGIGGLAGWVWRASHPALAVGGAATLVTLLWALARRAQAKVQMAWLMRSASVILEQARGHLPALEQRLDDFASRLIELARLPEVDEVLVVGHSSGAMLAVSVMARALAREPRLLEQNACVALLTLGHCIPVLSYQPEAMRFRGELARLRQEQRLTWLDFTAPPDGCCFALMDPTEVCLDGLQGSGSLPPGGPKRLSPRFAQSFSSARYRSIRRDKYRCHFQYLMATEVPAAYDYFSVTAGPIRLADRFANLSSVTGFRDFQCFGGPKR
ncbi:hypothetical protein [Ideonella sp. YS5]|uniref:hypothetical protein n=1 Tax=Ideonella sp. YS5 TaxID=3453714 RepID=UPI003EE9CFE6